MNILNNSSLIGFLGVIVGAFFSILVTFINNNHSLKVLNIQEHQKEKEALINDKKNAYFDFLLLQQKIFILNLAQLKNDNESLNKISEEIIYLNQKLKVEISLYFPEEIKNYAYKVLNICDPKSEKDAEEYNILRRELMDKIINLMKKDLSI